jgi:transcriptional regulator with XRE-family HTH domain
LASATFGRRLAAIRSNRSLTQAELGAAIGASRQTISHWETCAGGEVQTRDIKKCARVLRCRVKDLLAPAAAPLPFLDRSLWSQTRRRLKRQLAKTGPRPRRARRTPGAPPILSGSRPKDNTAAEEVLLGTIRSTLDPNAVAAVVRALGAEHGSVFVNEVLAAVELRLDKERKTFEAMRAMTPIADEQ